MGQADLAGEGGVLRVALRRVGQAGQPGPRGERVGVEQGHVVAVAAGSQRHVVRGREAHVRVQPDGFHPRKEAECSLQRAVLAGVVHDQDPIRAALLGRDRLQAPAQPVAGVPVDDDDGDLHAGLIKGLATIPSAKMHVSACHRSPCRPHSDEQGPGAARARLERAAAGWARSLRPQGRGQGDGPPRGVPDARGRADPVAPPLRLRVLPGPASGRRRRGRPSARSLHASGLAGRPPPPSALRPRLLPEQQSGARWPGRESLVPLRVGGDAGGTPSQPLVRRRAGAAAARVRMAAGGEPGRAGRPHVRVGARDAAVRSGGANAGAGDPGARRGAERADRPGRCPRGFGDHPRLQPAQVHAVVSPCPRVRKLSRHVRDRGGGRCFNGRDGRDPEGCAGDPIRAQPHEPRIRARLQSRIRARARRVPRVPQQRHPSAARVAGRADRHVPRSPRCRHRRLQAHLPRRTPAGGGRHRVAERRGLELRPRRRPQAAGVQLPALGGLLLGRVAGDPGARVPRRPAASTRRWRRRTARTSISRSVFVNAASRSCISRGPRSSTSKASPPAPAPARASRPTRCGTCSGSSSAGRSRSGRIVRKARSRTARRIAAPSAGSCS